MIRSILAVGAGFLAFFIIAFLAIAILFAAGARTIPQSGSLPTSYLLRNLALNSLFVCGGGLVTGLLARRAELLHGGVLGLLVAITFFGKAASWAPLWYMFLLIALCLCGAVFGGYMGLRLKRLRSRKTISEKEAVGRDGNLPK